MPDVPELDAPEEPVLPDELELVVPELDAVKKPEVLPAASPSEESPLFPASAEPDEPDGPDGSEESAGSTGPALKGPILRGSQSIPHESEGTGGAAIVAAAPARTIIVVADQPTIVVVFMQNPSDPYPRSEG
mgnify:CR=1 FL=1